MLTNALIPNATRNVDTFEFPFELLFSKFYYEHPTAGTLVNLVFNTLSLLNQTV